MDHCTICKEEINLKDLNSVCKKKDVEGLELPFCGNCINTSIARWEAYTGESY
jgi:hypothetical protein